MRLTATLLYSALMVWVLVYASSAFAAPVTGQTKARVAHYRACEMSFRLNVHYPELSTMGDFPSVFLFHKAIREKLLASFTNEAGSVVLPPPGDVRRMIFDLSTQLLANARINSAGEFDSKKGVYVSQDNSRNNYVGRPELHDWAIDFIKASKGSDFPLPKEFFSADGSPFRKGTGPTGGFLAPEMYTFVGALQSFTEIHNQLHTGLLNRLHYLKSREVWDGAAGFEDALQILSYYKNLSEFYVTFLHQILLSEQPSAETLKKLTPLLARVFPQEILSFHEALLTLFSEQPRGPLDPNDQTLRARLRQILKVELDQVPRSKKKIELPEPLTTREIETIVANPHSSTTPEGVKVIWFAPLFRSEEIDEAQEALKAQQHLLKVERFRDESKIDLWTKLMFMSDLLQSQEAFSYKYMAIDNIASVYTRYLAGIRSRTHVLIFPSSSDKKDYRFDERSDLLALVLGTQLKKNPAIAIHSLRLGKPFAQPTHRRSQEYVTTEGKEHYLNHLVVPESLVANFQPGDQIILVDDSLRTGVAFDATTQVLRAKLGNSAAIEGLVISRTTTLEAFRRFLP